MWSFLRLERLLQDVGYAARMFRRVPGFTSVAVLSLALGIGGNAAMFSLVNALLIRPLPYPEPDRLLRITGVWPRAALPFFEQRGRAMEVAAAGPEFEFNLTGTGDAIRVAGSAVSANLLTVLGTPAERGRTFAPGENSPGRDAVVILSDTLWRTKFRADPAVVGRMVAVNGTSRDIVGIMPPGFHYPSAKTQLWIPMRLDPSDFLGFWGSGFVPLIGRLKTGVDLSGARAELHGLAAQFLKTFPYTMPRGYNLDSTAIPLKQDLVGAVRGKLIILLASVAVVLLIACTNVASLLLSRATARRKEIALRTALGAGRMRVVRQLLTESLLLALAGGSLGIALGAGGLSVFKSVLPPSIPGLEQAAIDPTVAAAIAALALLTGLVFGIAPALSASQIDLAAAIRTGGQRSAGAGWWWTRLRTWLIAAQVALTVVLVVSAGLLMRSLYMLSESHPGFVPDGILTVRISPNQSFCTQRPSCVAFYDRLLARAREIPGVAETAIANTLPLDGGQPSLAVDIEDHPKSADFPSPLLWGGAVSPGYIRMMRIPLVAGRDLSAADGPQAQRVILISAETAKHFWPGENPIGKHIKTTGENQWRTVVGVVGDVRQFRLGAGFPDFIPGAMYMPYAQSAREDGTIPAAMTLMSRSRSERVGRDLRVLAQDQDPNIAVGPVVSLEEIVAGSISDFRATIRVFLSFAGAAMLLAAIGIYGLVSYWVSQRTFEIGVRVAIGATRSGIVAMILRQGLGVAVCGAAAGLVGAFAVTRFLAGLLFGVSATDPSTFVAVAVLVLGVAAAATALPAWKASRIDPTRSLRAD